MENSIIPVSYTHLDVYKRQIYGLEPRNFEGTKGSYLYLNGSSSEQGTITVELGNRYSGEFVSCAVFTFDVISGDHREYLLRLSSDFLWYSGYVDSIRIISDVNITCLLYTSRCV